MEVDSPSEVPFHHEDTKDEKKTRRARGDFEGAPRRQGGRMRVTDGRKDEDPARADSFFLLPSGSSSLPGNGSAFLHHQTPFVRLRVLRVFVVRRGDGPTFGPGILSVP